MPLFPFPKVYFQAYLMTTLAWTTTFSYSPRWGALSRAAWQRIRRRLRTPGAARSGASTLLGFWLLLVQNFLQALSQEGSSTFMQLLLLLLHVPSVLGLLFLFFFFLLLLFLVHL
jgi:hypothetical protein